VCRVCVEEEEEEEELLFVTASCQCAMRLLVVSGARSASPLRPDGRSASPLRPDGRSASPLRPDGRSIGAVRVRRAIINGYDV
jgi:hypothetical protein